MRALPEIEVRDEALPLVGGRRFWTLSGVLPTDAWRDLFRTTYEDLARDFDPDGDGPVGLALVVPPQEAAKHPEAEWTDPRATCVAVLDGGAHLRVAYFPDADIAPRVSPRVPDRWDDLESGPPILVFDEQDRVTGDDVVDFWVREGAVTREEAEKRVGDVRLVAVDDADRVIAVSSAFLADFERLRTPVWMGRGFVGADHRRSTIGARLGWVLRNVLGERFASGRDTRAPGLLLEVQNEALRKFLPEAVWLPGVFVFLGLNDRGEHLRIHWFPGARVPGL